MGIGRRLSIALTLCISSGSAFAQLPANVAEKIEYYKAMLSQWATNSTIVDAVKASNTAGGLDPSMTNEMWDDLLENDPTVTRYKNSAAGKLLTDWEMHQSIDKLYVRDMKGRLVAMSQTKPLLYDLSTRPGFVNTMQGQAWVDTEIKPDPTTQTLSVQLRVPILDSGKPIGIIHTGVPIR